MSYVGMLRHRCDVLRLFATQVDGMTSHEWQSVDGATNVRCFLDLNFIRRGKDPVWTPEAGRRSDRAGVLFMQPKVGIKSGDRVVMTFGPLGTFEIQGAVDEAWRPEEMHHLELGVQEVGPPLA